MEETSSAGGFVDVSVRMGGVAAEEWSRAREKRARALFVEPRREWERAMARHL